MMTDKKICPLCGSDQIRQEKHQEKISDHYGSYESISLNYDCCEECGMDGDFAKANETLIRESIDRQRAKIVESILQEFSDQRVNFAGLERSLELPQRTLSKWKNGSTSPTAAGVALLKFIRIFPWLAMVSECNFVIPPPLMGHIIGSLEKKIPVTYMTERHETVTSLIIDAEYTPIASGVVTHYREKQRKPRRTGTDLAWFS